MDNRSAWARQLAEASDGGGEQPLRICRLCTASLSVTGAGISVASDLGHRAVVCATDPLAARIEDLQVTLGEGPCMDALRSGGPVLVPDLHDSHDFAVHRWPAFLDAALDAGVRAVFALPLRIGAINVGAMDLYRDVPGELSKAELEAALMAADAAALALVHLDHGQEDSSPSSLEPGAAVGMQVHQASGMVMAQLGTTIEGAFLALRARAFASGRPLTELATDVVERRLRFTAEDS